MRTYTAFLGAVLIGVGIVGAAFSHTRWGRCPPTADLSGLCLRSPAILIAASLFAAGTGVFLLGCVVMVKSTHGESGVR